MGFWQELGSQPPQTMKVPLCSGVLRSPLSPGRPAVWHARVIAKTQFAAEPTGPAGQPLGGERCSCLP